jgi:hypothetical protein
MTEPEKPTGEEQRQVLASVAIRLHQIGSANDAEDHGYPEDARRLRQEACAALEGLLHDQPFLARLLPGLKDELRSGHILGHGWSGLLNRLEELPVNNRSG